LQSLDGATSSEEFVNVLRVEYPVVGDHVYEARTPISWLEQRGKVARLPRHFREQLDLSASVAALVHGRVR